MNAPIVIFAFNRPDRLQLLLSTLQNCEGIEDAQVTVFIDGARNERELPQVLAVRELAERSAGPKWEIKARDENIGLRRAISSGVTEVVLKHGRAIVLEDDLVLSPQALNYFNIALDRFASEDDVWSISGYMYNVPQLRSRSTAIMLPFAHPWGWATWSRAWTKFDPNLRPDPEDMQSKAFCTGFNLYGLRNFSAMLDMADRGLVDSWYIRWLYTHFKARALSVFPPVSYVRNMGISGGTHASRMNLQALLGPKAELAKGLVEMPGSVTADYRALDMMIDSYDARLQSMTSELGRVKRYILSAMR